jgi:hypothetical protein
MPYPAHARGKRINLRAVIEPCVKVCNIDEGMKNYMTVS